MGREVMWEGGREGVCVREGSAAAGAEGGAEKRGNTRLEICTRYHAWP